MRTEYSENQRLLSNDIDNTKLELEQSLRALTRTMDEINRKLSNICINGSSAGFSEDLNVGAQAAKVQALTTKLASLVTIKNMQEATHEWFAPKEEENA